MCAQGPSIGTKGFQVLAEAHYQVARVHEEVFWKSFRKPETETCLLQLKTLKLAEAPSVQLTMSVESNIPFSKKVPGKLLQLILCALPCQPRIFGKLQASEKELTKIDNEVNDAYSQGIAEGFSSEILVEIVGPCLRESIRPMPPQIAIYFHTPSCPCRQETLASGCRSSSRPSLTAPKRSHCLRSMDKSMP